MQKQLSNVNQNLNIEQEFKKKISQNQLTDTVESDNDSDDELGMFAYLSQNIFQHPTCSCIQQFFQQHPVQLRNSSQLLFNVKLY